MDPQSRWESHSIRGALFFSPATHADGLQAVYCQWLQAVDGGGYTGDSPAVSRPGESQQDPGDEVLV